MRNSVAAIALIHRDLDGQKHWLARWNENWQAFSFIVGHKQKGESFRECLLRRVEEDLGLEPEADFQVAHKPHSHLEYTALAEGTRAKTAYTMELYPLTLRGDFAHETIDGDEWNRWLHPEEIKVSSTNDGWAVSGTMALLLEMAGLLSDPAE